ncbi:hypothetical protein GDO78_001067 [Eleutherodactylus coqui]|uniref:Uncharacterized protein n=1 Tax=Eleutherodactylus coqui TaxID=57060 RepID=A0A8J6FSG9_ELECQ|nr:hypothetical protein GDO78_001067 [Eleutherodactylus coqui]
MPSMFSTDTCIICYFWCARYMTLPQTGVRDFDFNVVIPNGISSFLKQHMGAAGPETPDVEALRLEIAELKQKYEAVLEENKELKAKLAQLEPHTDEKSPE